MIMLIPTPVLMSTGALKEIREIIGRADMTEGARGLGAKDF